MANLIKNSFRGGIIDESLSARIDLEKYNQSCKELKNFILQPQGGIYRRPGLRFVAEPAIDGTPSPAGDEPTLIPFVYNSEIAYIIALIDNNYKVYGNQTYIDEDVSFFDTEENKTADYAQSADTIYLVNRDSTPFKIIRTSGPISFDPFVLGFASNFPSPTGFTGVFTGGAGSFVIEYAITAITDDGQESLPVYYTETGGKSPLAWGVNNVETLTWNAVTGADSYNLYKLNNGIYGYIGNTRHIAGTPVQTFKDINYDPIISDSIPEAYNPFVSETPGVIALFQQRLWFANTLSKPQTIFASRVGDFENMNHSPIIRPDDSIENTIYSGRVDGIRWLAPFNKVIKVGTLEKQWELKSSSGGITPSDINIEPELEWGAAKVKPVLAGNSLIYVEDKGAKLFDVFESQQYRGFTGNNLSVNAPELFEGFEIVSMAYQRTPDPIIWCVRDDGKVVALTYLKNENIWGWHRHETDGLFKNVIVLPGAIYDEVYFIVYRNSKYLIEMLEDKWTGDIEDAKFLDSMITKDPGFSFVIVDGLDHLEGKEVYAFLTLATNPVSYKIGGPYTVSGGQISLGSYVSTVAHVGLPYDSVMAPVSVEFATQNQGASLGKIKTISDISLKLKESKGGKIGPRLDYLDKLKTVDYDVITESSFTAEAFSGDIRVTYPNKFNTDSSFFVVQDQPLPMTISAMFINVIMGDK